MTITYPRWWAIWIGPQQMHEPGSSLGKECPLDYPISSVCPTQVLRLVCLRTDVPGMC